MLRRRLAALQEQLTGLEDTEEDLSKQVAASLKAVGWVCTECCVLCCGVECCE